MTIDQIFVLIGPATVGLCVGNFLNVVIHRVPKMLERGWEAQCAELRGEEPAEQPAYNLAASRRSGRSLSARTRPSTRGCAPCFRPARSGNVA